MSEEEYKMLTKHPKQYQKIYKDFGKTNLKYMSNPLRR